MKLEARRVAPFLRDPGACRAVLLFGPDAGLVRERADALVRSVAGDACDPFRITELDRDHLAGLPGEMAALSLGGGRRVIRLRDATDAAWPAVQRGLDGPGTALLVMEAGELTPRSRLRVLAERSDEAVALPCYLDEGRTLRESIRTILAARQLAISPNALDWLCTHLGPDRAAREAGVEKLSLFAESGQQLDVPDVVSVVASLAGLKLDDALFGATAGDAGATDRAVAISLSEGMAPVAVLRAALLHLHRLQQARVSVSRGVSPMDAAKAARPPVFFNRVAAFVTALEVWSPEALAQSCSSVWDAERICKQTGAPAEALCRQVLFEVAVAASHAREVAVSGVADRSNHRPPRFPNPRSG